MSFPKRRYFNDPHGHASYRFSEHNRPSNAKTNVRSLVIQFCSSMFRTGENFQPWKSNVALDYPTIHSASRWLRPVAHCSPEQGDVSADKNFREVSPASHFRIRVEMPGNESIPIDCGQLLIDAYRKSSSRYSGNRHRLVRFLPVDTCGDKMPPQRQEQSWPIKHH